jgi:hypothetical protein
VKINQAPWSRFTEELVSLKFDELPGDATLSVQIRRGGAEPQLPLALPRVERRPDSPQCVRLYRFLDRCTEGGYEAAHADLARASIITALYRKALLAEGKIKPLPSEKSQQAADQLYVDTARKLFEGLDARLLSYKNSSNPQQKKLYEIWTSTASE